MKRRCGRITSVSDLDRRMSHRLFTARMEMKPLSRALFFFPGLAPGFFGTVPSDVSAEYTDLHKAPDVISLIPFCLTTPAHTTLCYCYHQTKSVGGGTGLDSESQFNQCRPFLSLWPWRDCFLCISQTQFNDFTSEWFLLLQIHGQLSVGHFDLFSVKVAFYNTGESSDVRCKGKKERKSRRPPLAPTGTNPGEFLSADETSEAGGSSVAAGWGGERRRGLIITLWEKKRAVWWMEKNSTGGSFYLFIYFATVPPLTALMCISGTSCKLIWPREPQRVLNVLG